MVTLKNLAWLIPVFIFLVGTIKVVVLINSSTENESIFSQKASNVYYARCLTESGDNKYCFRYVKKREGWRAYIIRMPSLRGRSGSGAITHQLYDHGKPYICWDRPVSSFQDIKAISHVWADNIQEYIATGKRFG